MKKFSYSIGFFFAVFLLGLGFYASYQYSCSNDSDITDPVLEAENPLHSDYHIKIEEDKVIVLLDDGTVYETTEISKDTLPPAVQEQISQGYVIKNSRELYSFLENFSS